MFNNPLLQFDHTLKMETMLLAQLTNLRKLLNPSVPEDNNSNSLTKTSLYLGINKVPLKLYSFTLDNSNAFIFG